MNSTLDGAYYACTGLILDMGLANERRRYNVTPSLIGRAHNQNDLICSHLRTDRVPVDAICQHSILRLIAVSLLKW